MYRLRLFGGVALEGPSGPLSGAALQKRRLALLAMLAAARGTGWSRDKLVAYLWAEHDEASARHRLADSVYVLRKALGESARIVVALIGKPGPASIFTPVKEEDWITWKKRLNIMGDPFLGMERLVADES